MTARDWLGSAVMLSFTLVAIQRWDSTGSIFFLLLAADNLVKSFFFYTRSNATANANAFQSLVAYASAALPLFYLRAVEDISPGLATPAQLLMIGGFLVVALATIDLGPSLGISPARRGSVKQSGIYSYLKHPMYIGHIVAEFGLVLANLWNAPVFTISIVLYAARMNYEGKILKRSPDT